jgi:hypothetical protein
MDAACGVVVVDGLPRIGLLVFVRRAWEGFGFGYEAKPGVECLEKRGREKKGGEEEEKEKRTSEGEDRRSRTVARSQ